MRVFGVGALVELRCPSGVIAGEIFVLRRHRYGFVGDRIDSAIYLRAKGHALDRRGPIAEPIHLRAGQHGRAERFSAFAASTASTTSYCGRKPEPNAPPTKGDITRTSSAFMPITLQT